MLEEPPLNPPKNGLREQKTPSWRISKLNFQKILSLQKITTFRGRGGRFALRVGPTLSHPEANRGDVRSVMKTSH